MQDDERSPDLIAGSDHVKQVEADLALIETAAHEAGAIALSFFGHDPEVWWKNGGESPVSAADFAANKTLEDILRKARPDYGWLSEESEEDLARLGCDHVFVVDPIDGTRGFLKGRRNWAVSVAVVYRGRPVAGVLVAPALGEVFSAHANGPAIKNGVPVVATQKDALNDNDVVDICLPASLNRQFASEFIGRIRPADHIPSLAYRLAMVADGRLDATLVRQDSHDWDLAAADIILERAGARLCDEKGQPLRYNRESVSQGVLFAANETLVATLLRHFGAGHQT